MPKISVIVPVYKVEPYLHRCVDSILAQTFSDFELLLVDDGSPDNCGAICDEYAEKDCRIRVFHTENRGQAAARNLALDWMFANSGSEYVSFVDSDDWVHPRYLELLYEAVNKFGVNISQCLHIETDGTDDLPPVEDRFSLITAEEEYIHYYSAFMWEKLFARQCWEKIRFPEGRIYEDVAIWYKLLFAEKNIAIVHEKLYYYFINHQSTIRKEWTPAKLSQVSEWEKQIRFLQENCSRSVQKEGVWRFAWVLKTQAEDIVKSTELSNRSRNKNRSMLMQRLRRLLRDEKELLKEAGKYSFYCDFAYPTEYRVYWTMAGIAGKLKRIVRHSDD